MINSLPTGLMSDKMNYLFKKAQTEEPSLYNILDDIKPIDEVVKEYITERFSAIEGEEYDEAAKNITESQFKESGDILRQLGFVPFYSDEPGTKIVLQRESDKEKLVIALNALHYGGILLAKEFADLLKDAFESGTLVNVTEILKLYEDYQSIVKYYNAALDEIRSLTLEENVHNIVYGPTMEELSEDQREQLRLLRDRIRKLSTRPVEQARQRVEKLIKKEIERYHWKPKKKITREKTLQQAYQEGVQLIDEIISICLGKTGTSALEKLTETFVETLNSLTSKLPLFSKAENASTELLEQYLQVLSYGALYRLIKSPEFGRIVRALQLEQPLSDIRAKAYTLINIYDELPYEYKNALASRIVQKFAVAFETAAEWSQKLLLLKAFDILQEEISSILLYNLGIDLSVSAQDEYLLTAIEQILMGRSMPSPEEYLQQVMQAIQPTPTETVTERYEEYAEQMMAPAPTEEMTEPTETPEQAERPGEQGGGKISTSADEPRSRKRKRREKPPETMLETVRNNLAKAQKVLADFMNFVGPVIAEGPGALASLLGNSQVQSYIESIANLAQTLNLTNTYEFCMALLDKAREVQMESAIITQRMIEEARDVEVTEDVSMMLSKMSDVLTDEGKPILSFQIIGSHGKNVRTGTVDALLAFMRTARDKSVEGGVKYYVHDVMKPFIPKVIDAKTNKELGRLDRFVKLHFAKKDTKQDYKEFAEQWKRSKSAPEKLYLLEQINKRYKYSAMGLAVYAFVPDSSRSVAERIRAKEYGPDRPYRQAYSLLKYNTGDTKDKIDLINQMRFLMDITTENLIRLRRKVKLIQEPKKKVATYMLKHLQNAYYEQQMAAYAINIINSEPDAQILKDRYLSILLKVPIGNAEAYRAEVQDLVWNHAIRIIEKVGMELRPLERDYNSLKEKISELQEKLSELMKKEKPTKEEMQQQLTLSKQIAEYQEKMKQLEEDIAQRREQIEKAYESLRNQEKVAKLLLRKLLKIRTRQLLKVIKDQMHAPLVRLDRRLLNDIMEILNQGIKTDKIKIEENKMILMYKDATVVITDKEGKPIIEIHMEGKKYTMPGEYGVPFITDEIEQLENKLHSIESKDEDSIDLKELYRDLAKNYELMKRHELAFWEEVTSEHGDKSRIPLYTQKLEEIISYVLGHVYEFTNKPEAIMGWNHFVLNYLTLTTELADQWLLRQVGEDNYFHSLREMLADFAQFNLNILFDLISDRKITSRDRVLFKALPAPKESKTAKDELIKEGTGLVHVQDISYKIRKDLPFMHGLLVHSGIDIKQREVVDYANTIQLISKLADQAQPMTPEYYYDDETGMLIYDGQTPNIPKELMRYMHKFMSTAPDPFTAYVMAGAAIALNITKVPAKRELPKELVDVAAEVSLDRPAAYHALLKILQFLYDRRDVGNLTTNLLSFLQKNPILKYMFIRFAEGLANKLREIDENRLARIIEEAWSALPTKTAFSINDRITLLGTVLQDIITEDDIREISADLKTDRLADYMDAIVFRPARLTYNIIHKALREVPPLRRNEIQELYQRYNIKQIASALENRIFEFLYDINIAIDETAKIIKKLQENIIQLNPLYKVRYADLATMMRVSEINGREVFLYNVREDEIDRDRLAAPIYQESNLLIWRDRFNLWAIIMGNELLREITNNLQLQFEYMTGEKTSDDMPAYRGVAKEIPELFNGFRRTLLNDIKKQMKKIIKEFDEPIKRRLDDVAREMTELGIAYEEAKQVIQDMLEKYGYRSEVGYHLTETAAEQIIMKLKQMALNRTWRGETRQPIPIDLKLAIIAGDEDRIDQLAEKYNVPEDIVVGAKLVIRHLERLFDVGKIYYNRFKARSERLASIRERIYPLGALRKQLDTLFEQITKSLKEAGIKVPDELSELKEEAVKVAQNYLEKKKAEKLNLKEIRGIIDILIEKIKVILQRAGVLNVELHKKIRKTITDALKPEKLIDSGELRVLNNRTFNYIFNTILEPYGEIIEKVRMLIPFNPDILYGIVSGAAIDPKILVAMQLCDEDLADLNYRLLSRYNEIFNSWADEVGSYIDGNTKKFSAKQRSRAIALSLYIAQLYIIQFGNALRELARTTIIDRQLSIIENITKIYNRIIDWLKRTWNEYKNISRKWKYKGAVLREFNRLIYLLGKYSETVTRLRDRMQNVEVREKLNELIDNLKNIKLTD